MKLSLALLVAALHLSQAAVLHTPPKGFQDAHPNAVVHDDAFFVTFKSPVGAQAERDHEAFRAQMKQLGIRYKERHSFSTLINAVSFEMDKAHVDKVLAMDAVKDVFPMVSHAPPKTIVRKADPKLRFAHGITGVQEVHETLGFTGKGVKVGIIDTGIDYMHPALGAGFGKGFKVAGGYDLVGDAYTGANDPQPDDDPRDCTDGKGGGHGTHVAGIVGARDKDFVGVAPDVTLHAYRVFGCEGSTGTDVMVAAMERAYKDGMDAINMSIGGGSSWADYPDAVVASTLAEKGMAVLSAMGNDGDKGVFQAESPGLARSGFGVASVDNIRVMGHGFTIDGEGTEMMYANSDEKVAFDYKGIEVVSAAPAGNELACKPLEGLDLTGKIALIRRGECLFKDKVQNAEKAGAKAVLIYNNAFGLIAPGLEPGDAKINVAGTAQANGEHILELLKKGKVTLTFSTEKKPFDNPTGGKISDFSSWGPGPELDFKPDIAAPGGLILSTWPLAMGGYNTISGTSMATPYATGVVALYIQARGKKDPREIRDILKNTAKPVKNWDGQETAPVQRQGAGLVNAKDAILTTTFVTPAVLTLNATDITGRTHEQTIKIKNTAKTAMIYTFDHLPASAVQAWDSKTHEIAPIPTLKAAPASVEFDEKRVRIPAGETAEVTLTITPNAGLKFSERWLYSGYVVVRPAHRGAKIVTPEIGPGIDWAAVEKQTEIYIPYTGMHGDFRGIKVLADPASGLPALTFANQTIVAPNTTATFSLKGTDVPSVNVRLAFPCRKLLVKVLSEQGKELGLIENGENLWLGQNDKSPDNLLYTLQWNGNYVPDSQAAPAESDDVPTPDPKQKAASTPADNGKYKLRILAQKPFNSGRSRRGFEQWDSPVFAVDRNATPNAAAPSKDTEGIEDGRPRGHTLPRVLDAIKRQGAADRQKAAQLAQDSMMPKPLNIPVAKE